jgi:hypothetical protein
MTIQVHQRMVHTVLMIALRLAMAWLLLSLLFTAFWALLLQVGRRFGNEPALNASAQDRAGIRAIYGDFADDDALCDEAPMYSEGDETATRDAVARIHGSASAEEPQEQNDESAYGTGT